ncbi:MAG: right-handed parallel beta-helix repeat-containing protein [Bacteroidota bacterium]
MHGGRRLPPLLCLCVLILGTLAHGATYYVSPSGNDSASGNTTAPFRTFAKSISRLNDGDTLVLRSGTYTERLDLGPLGENERAIVIRAEVPRKAIIAGDWVSESFCVGAETRISKINLIGLVTTGAEYGFVFTNASNITLRNCESRRCYRGLLTRNGSNFVMEDCDVHNNRFGVMFGFEGTTGVAGITIRRCTAINNADSERLANTDGFIIEGNCSRVVITDSIAKGSVDAGFDIKPEGSRVERCQALDNDVSGFKFWRANCLLANSLAAGNGIHGIAIAANGARVWNSTFARNGEGYSMQLEAADNSATLVRNCIFYGNAVNLIEPNMYNDNCNLYFVAGKGVMIYRGNTAIRISNMASGRRPLGPQSIVADPKFVAPGADNYRLASTSPGLGAGVWNALYALDLLGQRRLQGAPPDLGAFAYNVASAPAAPLALQATALPATSGIVQLQVHASASATAQVVIRNLAGRIVGTLANQPLQQGSNTLLWSGRLAHGTLAPAGSYLAEITAYAAMGDATRCLVRLRK